MKFFIYSFTLFKILKEINEVKKWKRPNYQIIIFVREKLKQYYELLFFFLFTRIKYYNIRIFLMYTHDDIYAKEVLKSHFIGE